jgi:hypothetical protein
MAYNFVAGDRDQLLLMPPSLADWLPADHLAIPLVVRQPPLGRICHETRPRNDEPAAINPAKVVSEHPVRCHVTTESTLSRRASAS